MSGGRKFKPKEPYTHRLKKILVEYPESSQVLREILQNSDDAQSTEQVFILDHNTYHGNKLLESELSRFQGPALLSKNNTKFNDDDFKSLENLADSEKQDQYDKIGEMGVGFNSIYHLCDSCSFITDDKFVILDPHEWCYEGGNVYDNFARDNLSQKYSDQFYPFKNLGKLSIPCDGSFEGTIFRYPLRTKQGSKESKISKTIYEPNQILEMFKTFFEKDSINCLLFLRYIERIEFYELKEGKSEPELLYRILLKDAEKVRKKRQLIVKEITPMMKDLKGNKLKQRASLDTSYHVSLVRYEKEVIIEDSSWFIVNMLGDLHETNRYFRGDFGERLGTVPNVGLAAKLNSGQDEDELHGGLFCFFPLQIDTPFRVSINGHFAVTNNRRDLWSGMNKDLATNSLANLKVRWNHYLFKETIPQAWVKFLIEIQPHVSQEDYYEFWPILDSVQLISSPFFINLLESTISKLNSEDKIFCGPSEMLSISTGYFQDESYIEPVIQNILSKIEFPVIHAPSEIIKALKKSDMHSPRFYSPSIASEFLQGDRGKWQNKLTREETLELFNYLLRDENYEILEGLKMIPLADGTFKTISQHGTITYICPDSFIGKGEKDPREIFKDQLDKFIAKDLSYSLLSRLSNKVTTNKWNFNIKMLTVPIIAGMVKDKIYLNHPNSNDIEIDIENRVEWINRLWNYLCDKFNDLASFEDIHLIPTKQNTLRKLKTNQIKLFWNSTEGLQSSFDQIHSILEKFGIIFVNGEFEDNIAYLKIRLSAYIHNIKDIKSVLSSLNTNEVYDLYPHEAELFIRYLSYCLYMTSPLTEDHIGFIKCLPIFKEVGKDGFISLKHKEKAYWFLLPREDEKEYGQIIAPTKFGFLDATSTDTCYLLEKIIKIRRLSQAEYWINYVVPHLKVHQNTKIVIEKLFERLPTLINSDYSLKGKLSNLAIVPCGTIRMAEEKQDLDTVMRRPIDLYDPSNHKITQLFFDDEETFPAEKFSNLHYPLLKNLGIKTSLSSKDVVERINTYVKRQKTGNNIDDVYDKSLNLLIYIDKNWDSFGDNNNEFLSNVKSSKWIPTINKFGKKSFSCSSECRDKRDMYSVSLALSILDYKIDNKQFRKHLEWNRYPHVRIVLNQMELCSTMPKDNLNIKNQPKICEAIYQYINEALSSDDEQSKQEVKELKEGLKGIKWIYCEGNFYASKDVVFTLSLNFGKELPIIQLPADYQNKFSKVFEHMGIRNKVDTFDFIDIIRNIAHEADNKPLNEENLSKTIRVLDQIGKECTKSKKEGKFNDLKKLFIPSTDAILVNFDEIKFDDRTGQSNEEKENCKLSHPKISLALARELGIQMFSEMFTKDSEINFEDYEQSEPLTTRIRKIISYCTLDSLFKEFLQNADDAGARRFSIYIDERPWHENDRSLLLSEEMYNWQGPAVWIYNDATFEEKDFSSLTKLGVGGKSGDDSKIGRFGIGITTSYHLTDVLSFVSGEQIAFLDPHAKFLPIHGNPPKRSKGIKLNFLEKKFLTHFEDQCRPYLAIEDCDFKKFFNGTLFRLPLRSVKLSGQSLVSQNSVEPKDILDYLCNVKAKIQDLKDVEIRRKVDYESQVFQLDTKICDAQKNKTTFEKWLVCTGGKPDITDHELNKFSKNERLTAHGGIAAILARSENEALNNPLDLIDPPDLDGKEYAYVSCNGSTNLGVHINGNFSLSRDRMVILQPNDNICGKWNKHIFLEVLPSLHVKLLDGIAKIDYEHFKTSNTIAENFVSCITKKFWPFSQFNSGLDYRYAIKVLQNLDDSEVFWTEADGGKFVSLKTAYFSEENDHAIANILAKYGIPTVKMDENTLRQLKESQKQKGRPAKKYQVISPASVYKLLQESKIIESIQQEQNDSTNPHEHVLILLKFVLQDKNLYSNLKGFQLVPLKDGSLGTFGKRNYYIAKQKYQYLFPKSGPSCFVYDSDDELNKIFENKDFSRITNIKKLDALGILDLLAVELPNQQEIHWDPSSEDIPNRNWLDEILEKMKWGAELEITRLLEYPLLPVISPINKLVRMDLSNPLLNCSDNPDEVLVRVLRKLGICLTNIKFNNRNINRSEFFKKGVVKWSYYNVFDSIKRKQESQNISMKSFFDNAMLNEVEFKKLREFVKDFFNFQGRKDNIIEVIKEFPIWPIRSSRPNDYVSAKNGKLPPRHLSCYLPDTNIFIVEDEYFIVLDSLGAKKIEAYDYVKQHYPPDLGRSPTQQDVEFLEEVLVLGDHKIEEYLKNCESIPNKNLRVFARADTLFDASITLFSQIFGEDEFLPSELQKNLSCRAALSRIGLNQSINIKTYMKCAGKIEKKINDTSGNCTDEIIRSSAKTLAECLNSLLFKDDELKQLSKIKFLPSNKSLPNPYSKTTPYTSGYESFNSLYPEKYLKICWTQAKFFASDIPQFVHRPNVEMVIEHWNRLFVDKILLNSSEWEVKDIYQIMKEIYQFVNDSLEEGITKPKLKDLYFLNGDNPFDLDCWVLGNNLAFGIQNYEGRLKKVRNHLEPFKKLLEAAGARTVKNNIPIDEAPNKHSRRKDVLVKYLIKYLQDQKPDSQYHDVIFKVGNHEIGANSFVLSDVAEYFDWEFSVNPIIINGIQPNTYKVLLRSLYGMSYPDAVEDVFGEGFDGQHYVEFILDFLRASYKYPPLNDLIQTNIMKRRLVNERNAKQILELSLKYRADRLKNYCENYIEENKDIVDAIGTNQIIPQNCTEDITQNIPQNCTG
ncbi:16371_t:CDS:10 [Dentiscutata erythropus]|uniref:16371_t:CDS:1 n=1 Tax=Dentiscutata erythropus TaxID=1348616 RepID=A0A9N9CR12_9GLOM|nr:16371_t:CDS:10 [Dentiscutata erythropus]